MNERSIMTQFLTMLQQYTEEDSVRVLTIVMMEPFFENNVEFSTTKKWQDCIDDDASSATSSSSKKTYLVIRTIEMPNIIIYGNKNESGKYNAKDSTVFI